MAMGINIRKPVGSVQGDNVNYHQGQLKVCVDVAVEVPEGSIVIGVGGTITCATSSVTTPFTLTPYSLRDAVEYSRITTSEDELRESRAVFGYAGCVLGACATPNSPYPANLLTVYAQVQPFNGLISYYSTTITFYGKRVNQQCTCP